MTVGKYIIYLLFWVVNIIPAVFLFCRKGGKLMENKAKQAKNEYMKQWRFENKDKVKAAQDRYWVKKADSTNKGGINQC